MGTYALTLTEIQKTSLLRALEVECDRLETCLNRLRPEEKDDLSLIGEYIAQTTELVGRIAAAPPISRRGLTNCPRQLRPFDGRSFYGKRPGVNLVRGLEPMVKHGSTEGHPYSWLVFKDGEGDKWKIAPTKFRENGLPDELKVFVRSRRGSRSSFSGRSCPSAPGTLAGLYELVCYIRQCETAWNV